MLNVAIDVFGNVCGSQMTNGGYRGNYCSWPFFSPILSVISPFLRPMIFVYNNTGGGSLYQAIRATDPGLDALIVRILIYIFVHISIYIIFSIYDFCFLFLWIPERIAVQS
jgi:hypothetical protein